MRMKGEIKREKEKGDRRVKDPEEKRKEGVRKLLLCPSNEPE